MDRADFRNRCVFLRLSVRLSVLFAILMTVKAAGGDGFPPLRLGDSVEAAPGTVPQVVPPSASEALRLYIEGRDLLRAKHLGAAITKLAQAAEKAGAENLPAEDR